MPKKLVLASHNQGKLQELQAMLGNKFNLYLLSEFTNISPTEAGLSFVENAILKARFAAKISNLPALADDSGLMVDYLNGAPGIYSARFAQGEPNFTNNKDVANYAKLLRLMQNVPQERRGAQFVCVLALVNNELDQMPLICTGIWRGTILNAAIGNNGFGYDPIFWLEDLKCSSAQLSKQNKNAISHRALAFTQLQSKILHKL